MTAGNVYNGTLAVSLENETLGSAQLKSATRQLVQGSIDRDIPSDWFYEFDLAAPTNYVPETQMPGCTDGHSHYIDTIAMKNMKGVNPGADSAALDFWYNIHE